MASSASSKFVSEQTNIESCLGSKQTLPDGHDSACHGEKEKLVSEKNDLSSSGRTTRFFKTQFQLQDGVGLGHALTFCFAVTLSICAFVLANAQQANLLVERFHVPRHKKGSITSTLVVADEALSVLLIAFWGFISDLLGRRVLYAIGFLITAVGLAIVPHATCIFGPSFFSSLLFFRLIFSTGCSIIASLMVAILSDTATDKSRGRFSAVVGVCSGLGAVLGALFFPKIPVWLKLGQSSLAFYQWSYYPLSLCLCVMALVVLVFISTGPQASHVLHQPTLANAQRQIVEAFAATRNPMVALAYFSGFIARSITSINTACYTLWVTESYQRADLCQRSSELVCQAAYERGHMLHGILQTTSLVFAPLYGYLARRVSNRLSIMIACLFCVIAYLIMIAVQAASSKWQYLASILAGAGQIGIVITGMSLVAAHSPIHLRGSISGAYGFFGALGILVNSKIAGVLFDVWTPIAPFMVLFYWTSMLLLVTACLSYYHMRKRKKIQLSTQDSPCVLIASSNIA